jgi:hypothetical protein
MRDLRGSYKGISKFYLKIYKTLEFYLSTAQDPSDGYKLHGGR